MSRTPKASRWYSFTDPTYGRRAFGAAFFISIWTATVCLAPLGMLSEGMSLASLVPATALLGLITYPPFVAFGRFLWRSIPRRITLKNLNEALHFFEDRRFVLVLWATRDYEDKTGQTPLGWNKDSGQDEYQDHSWDSAVASVSRRYGCESMRLYQPGDPHFVGNELKSTLVYCSSDLQSRWKQVVKHAMAYAQAIVLYHGMGPGFEWELEQVQSEPFLSRKAIDAAQVHDALPPLLAKHADTDELTIA